MLLQMRVFGDGNVGDYSDNCEAVMMTTEDLPHSRTPALINLFGKRGNLANSKSLDKCRTGVARTAWVWDNCTDIHQQ
ncbi:hypothetical protein PVT68_11200 [Microbulbifer bruguierae]|uniref:Uncharacterized protein n=1 Tax=Microbulbifer bruguierae TaxID=3029061 RepID=A0ABY8NA75_9GAMM|nr:hypothetical protein [Microbulbifer bruguierae]WGL15334.1 hypothetical protein PVT68_11200 [Microbulbifer bruguierae]